MRARGGRAGAPRRGAAARPIFAAISVLVALLWAGAARAEGVVRTVLVIDASSSMRSTDPKELRKAAAELYVDLARDGDQIAVTGFDGAVRESTGAFTTIRGPAERGTLKQAVRAVGNDGSWTDFTAGLLEAKRLLDAAPDEAGDQEFVLFLTDGRCDPDPKGALAEAARAAKKRVEEVCQERVLGEIVPALGRARVYAIGLSKGAPKAFLEGMGARTGGVGLATDRAEELPRLFADVYARLLGSRLVEGEAAPSIDVVVGEGVLTLDAILVGPPSLSLRVLDASGKDVPTDNRSPAEAYFADSPSYRLIKVMKPQPGTYKLLAGGTGKGRYAVLQNLDLRLDFVDLPEVTEVGKPRAVRVRLATPGGKMPAGDFLDRHEVVLRWAEAPGKCAEALRDQAAKGSGLSSKLKRGASGAWEHTFLPMKRGELCAEAVLSPGAGGVLSRVLSPRTVKVVPPLKLLAAAGGFGSVKQGEKGPAAISFEGSEIGEAIEVELVFSGAEEISGLSIAPRTIALEPGGARAFELGVEVDRDAKGGARAIQAAARPVKPKGYEERAAALGLSITIVPLTFWERYGFWVKVGSGALAGLLLLIGIFGPARFRKGTMLYYKDVRDPDLPREGSYPLAAKAKAGFYRGARAMVGPTGPVRAGGVVELLAGPGGGVLARPLGGRKVREVPREAEGDGGGFSMGSMGSSSAGDEEGRPVVLNKEGTFRAMPGARYAVEGAGLVFWVTAR